MAAVTEPLVGRDGEIASIGRALRRVVGGRFGVLEIVGEPGIGKSRLIAEACARAESTSALVLAGRCAEFEEDYPFGVLVDALDDYVGTLNRRRLEALGGDEVVELARVFPSLAGLVPPDAAASTPSTERFRLHRAVRTLLESLAVSAPVVIALDDLHWADAASIEVIGHLLRKGVRGPVLLVLAYRARQAPRALETALADAARDGSCERLEPGPLTRSDADGLFFGDRLDEPTRAAVFASAGGNPFYLEQLARDAARRPSPAATLAGPAEVRAPGAVPATVSAALDDEIDALGPDARTSAKAAAVAGESFEPALVAAIAELSEADAHAALDELIAADLLRPTDVPMRFRFRHPIVRRAVYEGAGAGWRIGAHARAAAALEAAGAAAMQRAHHVERSAEVGDDAAVALLVEAGHATATRAPATAAGWFSAALRLLPATPESDGQRLGLLVPLASALGAAGRLREARDTLEELRVLIPPELGVPRAQVTILRAQVDNLLGDHGSGRALLEATLAEYADVDPAVVSDIKLAISADAFLAGDWEGMYSWAVPAYEAIRSTAEPVVRASAAAHLAGACYITSRFDECVSLLDTATALVDAATDEQLAARLTSLHWLGWCEEYLQRYDASIGHLERCLGIARATGQGQLIVGMMTALSSSLAWSGRLHEAEDVVEAAAEAALLAGNDQFMVWALQVQSRVRLLRGDVRSAVDMAAEAVRLSLDDPLTGVANCLHGEALIESGEWAAGRDAILAGGGRDLSVLEQGSHPRWCDPMVRAQIALGDLDEASHWVDVAEAAADACSLLAGRRSEALRARAELCLARGDARAAADAALDAVEAAGSLTMPIEEARARMVAGRALAVVGDEARASAELETARASLAACGADRWRDAAAQELRRLGKRVARPRARAATGGALSPREREIAELVTVGKTNRQIATDLFLSEKTVETHLSHVFAKLGVSSRAAVASALAAGGTNGD